ncbi:MAG: fructose-6-phosphate aldolase [Clostridia bacterium]|nr:fructose-6-phosphate aldolase [Clostridia bacterium]
MLLFLDTADLDEIRTARSWGVVSGVTTNPTLVAKAGHRDVRAFLAEASHLVDGPLHFEVTALDREGMVREGRELASVAPNLAIKVPCTEEGLGACRALAEAGIPTNVTLVFSLNQALLAARAGAAYVSPFVGRLDDIGADGLGLVKDVVRMYALHGIAAKVLAASLRHPRHVTDAALAGAQIGTMPFSVLRQMVRHPLTDAGLARFMADWERLDAR